MLTKTDGRRLRARKIARALARLYPEAKMALRYRTRWELLVAVVLSAQCTDKMVNQVTSVLFGKYKKLDDYVNASRGEFEKDIRKTGFYKNKTKSILAAARMVKEKYKGKIPRTMEKMLAIPGVARKTANVVLGNAYGVVEGIAVDTHVRRLALKFELTESRNPEIIEKDLMSLLPKEDWFLFTYRAIEYGRRICPARKHDCRTHPLTKIYPRAARIWPKPH